SLAVDESLRVEVVDLAGEFRGQAIRREALGIARRAAALDQTVPVLLEVLAERIDRAHAGHDYAGMAIGAGRPIQVGTHRIHCFPTSARILPTSWFSIASRVTRIAFFIARASERPCATTATPSMPSRGAPPNSLQSIRARIWRTPGRIRSPPILPVTVLGISSRRLRNRKSAVASAILIATLPRKPSATTTSALPSNTSLGSMLPTKLRPVPLCRRRALTSRVSSSPLLSSSPLAS